VNHTLQTNWRSECLLHQGLYLCLFNLLSFYCHGVSGGIWLSLHVKLSRFKTAMAVILDTLIDLGYQGSPTADSISSDSKDKRSSNTYHHRRLVTMMVAANHHHSYQSSMIFHQPLSDKHSRHSDSRDVVSHSNDNSFDDNFPFTVSDSWSSIAGGASATATASAGGGWVARSGSGASS
jgi:hypothetical protein